MKICIDAGHNYSGADTGATGNGLREQDITFYIAEKLNRLLQSVGIKTIMTRNNLTDCLGTSTNTSLQKRVQISNYNQCNLYISIHCNAGGGTGTETYIVGTGGEAEKLANKVQTAIVNELGTVNRGVKVSNFYVIKNTSCPAILIETAFIDTAKDAELLKNKQNEYAKAVFNGVCAYLGIEADTKNPNKEEGNVPLTVQKLDNIYVQEIAPLDFGIYECDCKKRSVGVKNYFNLGFFAEDTNGTIPIGNVVDSCNILSNAKENANWINVSGHALTTLYVTNSGKVKMEKVPDISSIPDVKTAISGIPIIRNSKQVTMEEIKEEGYFGNECYDTWHGFLGIRHGKIVYVAAKCDFGQMCWILVALGIYDAIKLDGGGSFILHNGKEIVGTCDNRRINTVGMW